MSLSGSALERGWQPVEFPKDASLRSRRTTYQEFTATVEPEWSECVRHDCGIAGCQVTSLFTCKIGLPTEDHEYGEPRVNRRFPIQCHPCQPEVGVCCFRQHRGPESGRTYQLIDLLSAAAATFHGLQGKIESQAQMSVTFAVQFKVLPFQQDRQVLRLLQFHQEDPFTGCMQHTRWHIDNVAGMHLDSVEQVTQDGHVLGHYQRSELVQDHIGV